MPSCKNINHDQFVLHRMHSSDSFTQLWLENAAVDGHCCGWRSFLHCLGLLTGVRGRPTLLRLSWWSLWFIASEMFLCMCVFFKLKKKKEPKAILKSSSMVQPHVMCTSTTCCWSTVGNKRLPKSLVTTLQCPFLTAKHKHAYTQLNCTNDAGQIVTLLSI